MKSHSALYKVTIAPGATININATGSAIFVRLAAQVFRITLGGGQTIDAEEGFDYVGEDKERFTRLELSNPNLEELDVELFVSDGTVRRGPLRFSRDAPTIAVSNENTEVSSAVSTFTGRKTVGKHRRQIVFVNRDTVKPFHVWVADDAGTISVGPKAFTIAPSTALTVFTGSRFRIFGNDAGAQTVNWVETYYQ